MPGARIRIRVVRFYMVYSVIVPVQRAIAAATMMKALLVEETIAPKTASAVHLTIKPVGIPLVVQMVMKIVMVQNVA